MVRENYDDSLIVFRCPSCLYGKLLSINKLEGFNTLFSVHTFVTRWLCNCDLASSGTPFSYYHHPSHKMLQHSKMPTTDSECHPFQQPHKNYFRTVEKIYLPYPKSTTDTQGLANTASFRAPKATCWPYPNIKDRTKIHNYYILRFWTSRFCTNSHNEKLWIFLKTVHHTLQRLANGF